MTLRLLAHTTARFNGANTLTSICQWALQADIGHRYYGPETGDWVQESNPGPTKRSCCKVRESNPGPTKKIACKARGSNPGTTKRLFAQSCTRSLNTIMHAIVFCDRVYDRTNDLFSQSRVRTPGLARDLFCGSRVRFPDLAA